MFDWSFSTTVEVVFRVVISCKHKWEVVTLQSSGVLLLQHIWLLSSIAMVKARGEMVQPAIIPTSKNCCAVVYSVVVRQNCKSWYKYFLTRFVMVVGTWKKSKAVQRRECGMDPKALARSRNKTCRSLPFFFAAWIWCHIMFVCSKRPREPGIPAFCTNVSIRFFYFRLSVVILWAVTLKKVFPSTFKRLICRNWSMFKASFFLSD